MRRTTADGGTPDDVPVTTPGSDGGGDLTTENDDGGGGRVLTAEEKDLVGVWVPRPEYAIDYAGGIELRQTARFLA